MKPRISTSKKWTAFPEEYRTQIEGVFMQEFKAKLDNAKLIIEGRIYPEEILLRVGFLEAGRLKQNNFEVSMPHSQKAMDAVDRIGNCIDAVASMMTGYFTEQESEEESELPRVWAPFDFDGRKIWLQYSTVNTDLEAQANAILGEAAEDEDAMVKEEEESFEEIVPEDELPTDGPSMFSGKKKKKEDLH